MGESLTQRRRVRDEGLRIVNLCQKGKMYSAPINTVLMVPSEEAPANSVPAAAVIRRVQALSGIIGRKEFVGGLLSLVLNAEAQLLFGIGYWQTRMR